MAVPHHSAACIKRPCGTPVTSAVRGQRPLAAVVGDLFEADRVRVDERVIEPVPLDHDLQHAGEQRRVAAWFHRQVESRTSAPPA